MTSFAPGTYEIMITAISATKSDSFTVELHLVDPCPTVYLNPLEGVINECSTHQPPSIYHEHANAQMH